LFVYAQLRRWPDISLFALTRQYALLSSSEQADAREGAMQTITTHYIDGAFVPSHGREVADIIRPTDSEVIDDPQAPRGGFKFSGVGREYGAYGIKAFLETRATLEAA
jgi:hypothetical protein